MNRRMMFRQGSKNVVKKKAHAKINLCLHIGPKRADGYHDLVSIMAKIGLHDTLCFEKTEMDDLVVQGLAAPNGPDNLCWVARDMLRQCYPQIGPTRITLDKHIPFGAGLASGSTDAAATLVGLSELWDLPVRQEDFRTMAADIGADVAFCLCDGPHIATGIGERLQPVRVGPYWVVVVVPETQVVTKAAYAWLDAWRQEQNHHLKWNPPALVQRCQAGITTVEPARLAAWLHNDFEAVILTQNPDIAQAKAALRTAGAKACLLTGSGAAVFGLFGTQHEAQHVYNHMVTQFPYVYCVPLIVDGTS